MHALGVQNDDFPRLDIALILRADDVQRAGLRAEDPGITEPAQHQGPHAQRVADADHRVFGQRNQRVGALHLAQRVGQALDHRAAAAHGHQVDDHLGIAGGLEDAAAPDEVTAQSIGVCQVAVVPE